VLLWPGYDRCAIIAFSGKVKGSRIDFNWGSHSWYAVFLNHPQDDTAVHFAAVVWTSAQHFGIGEKAMKKNCMLLLPFAFALVAGQAVCAAQSESSSGSKVASPDSSASAAAEEITAKAGGSATSSATPAPSSPASGTAPQFQPRDPRYKIAASDSFDLTFPLSPEYNQLAVTVQPDGFVALYGVGDVKVQGLTIPELTDTLRKAYGGILHDPIISIVLKDFNKPYFIADGQVGHPGKYDLRAETTLTQAIAIAGGFTDSSKHSQVLLFRRVSDAWVSTQVFDVKKMEAKGDLREDPYMHPGDTIFIPKSKMSKIKPYLPSTSVGAFIPIY
jgi:polysaccharide biosynthesis/export protein